MKNAIIVISLLVISASCKKDHSCTCTSTVAGKSTENNISFGKTTRKNAKEKCDEQQSTLEIAAPGSVVICNID